MWLRIDYLSTLKKLGNNKEWADRGFIIDKSYKTINELSNKIVLCFFC